MRGFSRHTLFEHLGFLVADGDALMVLSRALHEVHGERVVILIDEYDTPIQAGYMNHFFEDVVGFFRNFLSAGLKDNNALFKGVLTGILRVAKENLFSGLKHITVHSILKRSKTRSEKQRRKFVIVVMPRNSSQRARPPCMNTPWFLMANRRG